MPEQKQTHAALLWGVAIVAFCIGAMFGNEAVNIKHSWTYDPPDKVFQFGFAPNEAR